MKGTREQTTQADIARVIRAAKQEGAREVEVTIGNARFVIRVDAICPPLPNVLDAISPPPHRRVQPAIPAVRW